MLGCLARVIAAVSLAAMFVHPSSPALAQEAPARSSPEARALLEKARAALTALHSMSYSATATTEGVKAPSYAAEVHAKRVEAGGWAIASRGAVSPAMDGKGNPGGKDVVDPRVTPDAGVFEVAYDGVTARSLREKEKAVIEFTAGELAELRLFFGAQNAGPTVAWELLDEKPFAPDDAQFSSEGKGMVGEVECQILAVTQKNDGTPTVTRYFLDDAGLVHRIDRVRGGDAGTTRYTQVLVLGDLKPDQALGSSLFVIPTPDEYTVKSARPPAPKRPVPERAKPREGNEGNGLLAKGSMAPDWTLKDPTGKGITLSSLRGRVVVLDFWATWCGPCRMAMPSVQKLHEKFKGKPVSVFGVDCWDQGDAVKHMKDAGFTYGLLLHGDDVAKRYKVEGIPTFYVIGPAGEVLWNSVGYDPGHAEEIAREIEKALANAGL